MTEPPRPPWEDNSGDTPSDPGAVPGPPPGDTAGQSYPPPGDTGAQPSPGTGSYPPPGDTGGYYPPPGQQYEWQPPGAPGSAPPPGYPSGEDRTWALAAHFGGGLLGFFSGGTLGWIVPLIAMVARGNQSPTVRQHAVGALNFQILWAIIAAAGYILGTCLAVTIVGLIFFLAPVVAIFVELIFGLIAGVKATEGQWYRYPASVSFVK
ncbi:MAG TPA: DUF4870 domain-containing protein [Micromonosporaceae bacterium]